MPDANEGSGAETDEASEAERHAAAAPAPPAGAERPRDPLDPSSFRSRGRMRRRARYLRRARELAYRDLGGLVFNLHRFGQRNDPLVLAKLGTLAQIDRDLRALEGALGERRETTVLREAGITACARCAAIHSSEDRFCPNCGLPIARHPDLPIAGSALPAGGSSASAPGAGVPAAASPAAVKGAEQGGAGAIPAPASDATDDAIGEAPTEVRRAPREAR
jgi:hypothetical protein